MSPEDETRERILRAAAKVFSEKGYAGATTRAIAAEASVNEVTLFRRFGSKKNLLLAMMEQNSPLPSLESALQEQLTGDYRQDLIKLGNHFLTTMMRNRRSVLMTLCTAERLPEVREVTAQVPLRQRQVVGDYLRRQMEQGFVRDIDPEMAAQAFLGMLFAYSINRGLSVGTPSASAPLEAVVAQFVDIFVQGTIKLEEKTDVKD